LNENGILTKRKGQWWDSTARDILLNCQ